MPEALSYYLGVPEPSWLAKLDTGPSGAYLCSGIPKFVSAARFARYRTDGDRWPVSAACTYAIDSGAYIALNGSNRDVPWFTHPDVYGGMILRWMDNSGYPPDFVAPQDWPCEPSVRARTGLTVREHQQLTLDSYLWLAREFAMVPWIPVLQGWEADDYRIHEQMYQDAGVDLAAATRVGVGSICRRGHLPKIVEVIEQFAGAGYQLHGFGIKTTALPRIGHLLRSADSMAWSQHARLNNIRLPGCEHAGDCRNCYRYAVRWRERVLTPPATRKDPTMSLTATEPNPLSMRFPAELRTGDVIVHPSRGRLTVVETGVASSSRPTVCRIVVEEGKPYDIDAFDGSKVQIVSRGSIDPVFPASRKGSVHLFVPLTDDPDVCGECGEPDTEKHYQPTAPTENGGMLDDSLFLKVGETDTMKVTGDRITNRGTRATAIWFTRNGRYSSAASMKFEVNGVLYPPSVRDEQAAKEADVRDAKAAADFKQATKVKPKKRVPAARAPQPELFDLAEFAAQVADELGLTADDETLPRTIPVRDVPWGAYGQLNGTFYYPDGSVCRKTGDGRGYATSVPRPHTSGVGDSRRVGQQLWYLCIDEPTVGGKGGCSTGFYAAETATFTLMEPPADRPLKQKMSLSYRTPSRDLQPGRTFFIYTEPGLDVKDPAAVDRRPRYHVQAPTRPAGDGMVEVDVVVDGNPTTLTLRGGDYVDVEDLREVKWQDGSPTVRPDSRWTTPIRAGACGNAGDKHGRTIEVGDHIVGIDSGVLLGQQMTTGFAGIVVTVLQGPVGKVRSGEYPPPVRIELDNGSWRLFPASTWFSVASSPGRPAPAEPAVEVEALTLFDLDALGAALDQVLSE